MTSKADAGLPKNGQGRRKEVAGRRPAATWLLTASRPKIPRPSAFTARHVLAARQGGAAVAAVTYGAEVRTEDASPHLRDASRNAPLPPANSARPRAEAGRPAREPKAPASGQG